MNNIIMDERIKFYLAHEDRIKEWAAIEKEIPELAHRFYLTLMDLVEEELDQGPSALDNVECVSRGGEWPQVGLRRKGWPWVTEFKPAIVIEWHRKTVGFSARRLVCGAYTSHHAPIEERCRRIFDHEDFKMAKQGTYYWLARRSLGKLRPRAWEEDGLAKYRDCLVNELFSAWNALAPLVDKAVKDTVTPQA